MVSEAVLSSVSPRAARCLVVAIEAPEATDIEVVTSETGSMASAEPVA